MMAYDKFLLRPATIFVVQGVFYAHPHPWGRIWIKVIHWNKPCVTAFGQQIAVALH